tara:strand:+ start:761 stop:1048 length:288 start_codon:yes stop_codon:yes gene_type:complete
MSDILIQETKKNRPEIIKGLDRNKYFNNKGIEYYYNRGQREKKQMHYFLKRYDVPKDIYQNEDNYSNKIHNIKEYVDNYKLQLKHEKHKTLIQGK